MAKEIDDSSDDEENTGFFSNLKQKYDDFIFSLEEKGIPAPSVLIPLIFLAVIGLVVYLLLPSSSASSNYSLLGVTTSYSNGSVAPGVAVSLYVNSALVDTLHSDSSGNASFRVLTSSLNGVSAVVKGTLNDVEKDSPISATSPAELTFDSQLSFQSQFNVVVKDVDNVPIEGASVEVTTSDGQKLVQTSDGSGQASFSSTDLQAGYSLKVSKTGYSDLQSSISKDQFSLYSINSMQTVRLEKNSESNAQSGTVSIKIFDASNNPLKGVTVVLTDSDSQTVLGRAFSSADGVAAFEGIKNSLNIVVSASKPGYVLNSNSLTVAFDSSGELVSSIILTKGSASDSKTSVVVSSDGSPVQSAVVNVYSNTELQGSFITDADGKTDFSLGSGRFSATIYSEGYLPSRISSLKINDINEVTLVKAAPENTILAKVHVTENGESVAGAQVSVLTRQGIPLGLPDGVTDADGQISFTLPKNQLVYFAALNAPSSGKSDLISISGQDTIDVEVKILPANGLLSIKLKDAVTQETVVSASCSLFNDEGSVALTATSDINGVCSFKDVPSQVALHLKVSTTGFIDYSTDLTLTPGQNLKLTQSLYSTAATTSLSAGITQVLDSNGNSVKELAPASDYTFRITVTSPQSVNNGFVKFKVGSGQSSADDSAFITSASGGDFVFSSADTPDCTPSDAGTQSGSSKWLVLNLKKGFTGSTTFDVKVKTKKQVTNEEKVPVFLRAGIVVKNVPSIYPSDFQTLNNLIALSQTKVLSNSDLCGVEKYQTTNFKLTALNLICTDSGLCYKLSFDAQKYNLGDSVSLFISLLSDNPAEALSLTSDAISFSDLSEAGTSFDSKEFPIDLPVGTKKTFIATGIAVKPSSRSPVSITVRFTDGSTQELKTGVRIEGKLKLKVAYDIFNFIAGTSNVFKATVTDNLNLPVTDAKVTLFSCEKNPLASDVSLLGEDSPLNGENGVYSFIVSPKSLGKVGVKVFKDGYQGFNSCDIGISTDNFMQATPEVLDDFTGDAKDQSAKEIALTSLIDEKVSVTSYVTCDTLPSSIFTISPKQVTLKGFGSQTFKLNINKSVGGVGACTIFFTGRIGNSLSNTVSASYNVNVVGPLSATTNANLQVIPNPIVLEIDATGTSLEESFTLAGITGNVITAEPRGKLIVDKVFTTVDSVKKVLRIRAEVPEAQTLFDSLNYNPYLQPDIQSNYYQYYLQVLASIGNGNYLGLQYGAGANPARQFMDAGFGMGYGMGYGMNGYNSFGLGNQYVPQSLYGPQIGGVPNFYNPSQVSQGSYLSNSVTMWGTQPFGYTPQGPQGFNVPSNNYNYLSSTNIPYSPIQSSYQQALIFPIRGKLILTTDQGETQQYTILITPQRELYAALQAKQFQDTQNQYLMSRIMYQAKQLLMNENSDGKVINFYQDGKNIKFYGTFTNILFSDGIGNPASPIIKSLKPSELQTLRGTPVEDPNPEVILPTFTLQPRDGTLVLQEATMTNVNEDIKSKIANKKAYFLVQDSTVPTRITIIKASFAEAIADWKIEAVCDPTKVGQEGAWHSADNFKTKAQIQFKVAQDSTIVSRQKSFYLTITGNSPINNFDPKVFNIDSTEGTKDGAKIEVAKDDIYGFYSKTFKITTNSKGLFSLGIRGNGDYNFKWGVDENSITNLLDCHADRLCFGTNCPKFENQEAVPKEGVQTTISTDTSSGSQVTVSPDQVKSLKLYAYNQTKDGFDELSELNDYNVGASQPLYLYASYENTSGDILDLDFTGINTKDKTLSLEKQDGSSYVGFDKGLARVDTSPDSDGNLSLDPQDNPQNILVKLNFLGKSFTAKINFLSNSPVEVTGDRVTNVVHTGKKPRSQSPGTTSNPPDKIQVSKDTSSSKVIEQSKLKKDLSKNIFSANDGTSSDNGKFTCYYYPNSPKILNCDLFLVTDTYDYRKQNVFFKVTDNSMNCINTGSAQTTDYSGLLLKFYKTSTNNLDSFEVGSVGYNNAIKSFPSSSFMSNTYWPEVIYKKYSSYDNTHALSGGLLEYPLKFNFPDGSQLSGTSYAFNTEKQFQGKTVLEPISLAGSASQYSNNVLKLKISFDGLSDLVKCN